MNTEELTSTIQKHIGNGYKVIVKPSETTDEITIGINSVVISVKHSYESLLGMFRQLSGCLIYPNEGSKQILVLRSYL